MLRVRDEGGGIAFEDRARIFEKYTQLGSPHAASRSSRRLGLSFCKLAVEALGGRIWVEENQPRGSCFCVHLPLLS